MMFKLNITGNKDYNEYWVYEITENIHTDTDIAKILNININDYFNLSEKCNGSVDYTHQLTSFQSKKDAEKFLNKLIPYIIIAKLNRR